MLILENDDLETIISQNKKVIVQFGASWCGNCTIIKPKFKNLAENHKDVLFTYVDGEVNVKSRELADIKYLPTFAIYVDGNLINQISTSNIEEVKGLLNEIANN